MYEELVDDFLKRHFPKDNNWLNGNCYYMALILSSRFPNFRIYYCPIEGHFIAGTFKEYYDWNGRYYPSEEPILFDEIDNLQYKRLLRDCIK